MCDTKIDACINTAKKTDVFKPAEIEVLAEVLKDCRNNPYSTYIIIEEKKDDSILGFVVFGRTPMTAFCWDIYWLVVDKNFQGKGIGKKLLQKAESYIKVKDKRAILRIESSGSGKFESAHRFYHICGFVNAGLIPDFYDIDDGLEIFYKKLIN